MTSVLDLKKIASELRKELVVKHAETKMAHIGSGLSCLDVMIALFFDILDLKKDHFILSKGHAALGLYAILHKKGVINDDIYATLGKNGSVLGEHPIYGVNGVEVATGSLGHGLSIGSGMALANKLDGKDGRIYVLLSDGECQEGSTLEAMNFIARLKLNNLVAIVDSNTWQAFDRTLIPIDQVKKEFLSFGWEVTDIDGHDYNQICKSLANSSNTPLLIVANTTLGKGIKQIEDTLEAHYKPPEERQIGDFIAGIE